MRFFFFQQISRFISLAQLSLWQRLPESRNLIPPCGMVAMSPCGSRWQRSCKWFQSGCPDSISANLADPRLGLTSIASIVVPFWTGKRKSQYRQTCFRGCAGGSGCQFSDNRFGDGIKRSAGSLIGFDHMRQPTFIPGFANRYVNWKAS